MLTVITGNQITRWPTAAFPTSYCFPSRNASSSAIACPHPHTCCRAATHAAFNFFWFTVTPVPSSIDQLSAVHQYISCLLLRHPAEPSPSLYEINHCTAFGPCSTGISPSTACCYVIHHTSVSCAALSMASCDKVMPTAAAPCFTQTSNSEASRASRVPLVSTYKAGTAVEF